MIAIIRLYLFFTGFASYYLFLLYCLISNILFVLFTFFSFCFADVTHYCSLLLPQRPEFADFKSLFQSDDSVFGNPRRSPGCDGMTVKRTICDVNSFDCENSDSDGEDVFSGYKTPKVENNFDTVAAVNTLNMRGHGVSTSTSRRISPSASGSLSPTSTSPTSVCGSAYVRVRLDHGVDGEKELEKGKSMEMGVGVEGERSEYESNSEDLNKCHGKSITLCNNNSSSNNVNNSVSVTGNNRTQRSQIEPFEYNCDNELNMTNNRNTFSFGLNDNIDYSTPF